MVEEYRARRQARLDAKDAERQAVIDKFKQRRKLRLDENPIEIQQRIDDNDWNLDGGKGSGNFGHAGRIGKVGGSEPQGKNNKEKVLPSARKLAGEKGEITYFPSRFGTVKKNLKDYLADKNEGARYRISIGEKGFASDVNTLDVVREGGRWVDVSSGMIISDDFSELEKWWKAKSDFYKKEAGDRWIAHHGFSPKAEDWENERELILPVKVEKIGEASNGGGKISEQPNNEIGKTDPEKDERKAKIKALYAEATDLEKKLKIRQKYSDSVMDSKRLYLERHQNRLNQLKEEWGVDVNNLGAEHEKAREEENKYRERWNETYNSEDYDEAKKAAKKRVAISNMEYYVGEIERVKKELDEAEKVRKEIPASNMVDVRYKIEELTQKARELEYSKYDGLNDMWNMREAEARLDATKLFEERTKMSGCTVDQAKEICYYFSELADRFPALEGWLMTFEIADLGQSTMGTFGPMSHRIRGGSKFFGSEMDRSDSCYDGKFHPYVDTGKIGRATVAHEVGHAIDYFLGASFYKSYREETRWASVRKSGIEEVEKKYKGYDMNHNAFSEQYFMRKMAKESKMKVTELREKTSEYAKKDRTEWFAESWCAYECMSNPPDYIVRFGKEVERLLKEQKRFVH